MVAEYCLLHNITENINKQKKKQKRESLNEKRCRNGMPKGTQTREVIKVKINKAPFLHLHYIVKRCRDG